MTKLRVVIADDSPVIRSILKKTLSADHEIEVVDVAVDGKEAFEKVKAHKPDLATIDINMPGVDGLEAIKNIMMQCPIPILGISGVSDSPAAFTALSKGALDVIPKSYTKPQMAPELIRKIKLLSKVQVIRHISPRTIIFNRLRLPQVKSLDKSSSKVIAIACSTGGQRVLAAIFSQLPKDYPHPILVAQHMEDVFVDGFVEWLKKDTLLTVRKAVDNEKLEKGTILISPPSKHMEIRPNERIQLLEAQEKDAYRPSASRLLESVASVVGERSVGIILTGTGNDGVEGIRLIKEKGGITIAQNQESSLAFGMPGEAIKSGCIDNILPIQDIGALLKKLSD